MVQPLSLCNSLTEVTTWFSWFFFVPIKGSLHHPLSMTPESTGLCKSRHPLRIGTKVHQGVINIHHHYHVAVIPVSSKTRLVLAAGCPPLSGPTGQEKKSYPQNLDNIHKQITPIVLFESYLIHQPSTPTVLFESSIWAPLTQNTAKCAQPISTKKVLVVSLTPTNHLFSDNLANPLHILPILICTNNLTPPQHQHFDILTKPCGRPVKLFYWTIDIPLLNPTNLPLSNTQRLTPNADGRPVNQEAIKQQREYHTKLMIVLWKLWFHICGLICEVPVRRRRLCEVSYG